MTTDPRSLGSRHQTRRRGRRFSWRSVSILAALLVDAGLIWFLIARADYRPSALEAEVFWVSVLFSFGAYAVLQQWSLASQTSRGDDFAAAADKFVAATPFMVSAALEAYWLGAGGLLALSWRHHAVALLWSAFAVTDFLATDITNQRLKARQVTVGDGSG